MDDNVTKFKTQEDFHNNQMRKLKELQHKNIVKLFSYQENCIPQFYVVENYLQQNLQESLKNCSNNKVYYSRSHLFKFLSDACAALEYCHSKDFVHRNLIASSLFLFGEDKVKLSGFQLCKKLVNEGKVVDQNNKGVPTLWTAPESLECGEYSKASDIWMLGHLMFEVLTHGLMPYAHIQKSDSEIVELIIDGSATLWREEQCIDKNTFKNITDCVQHDPNGRPEISSVLSRTEELYARDADVNETKLRYPDLSKAKPSTEYNVGTLQNQRDSGIDYNTSHTSKKIVCLSDTRRVYHSTGRYVFQERLLRPWPIDTRCRIESGVLDHILKPIKIFEAEADSQYIEFSIPEKCIGSLRDVTVKGLLGKESPRLYLYCIYQVALLLEKMYAESWVLGDLCASNVYIECQAYDINVHIGSLSQLVFVTDYQEPERDTQIIEKPQEPDVVKR